MILCVNRQVDVMNNVKNRSQGFTLIEVLIALTIAGIVMSAIYSISIAQMKTYTTQDQIVQLQRGLRFGMALMERDIRKTGYNPGGLTETRASSDSVDNDCDGMTDEVDNAATLLVNESEAVGFLEATVNSVTFSQDMDGDGSACGEKEIINYTLNGMTLKRNGTPLSGNIEVLNFIYLAENGGIASQIENIRSVQIAMIGRTKDEDSSYTNTNSYLNLQGGEILSAQNDGYRRRLLTSQVYVRNLKY
jgi:prepilin-type N-terminal cleavage/methylation domain-containing protein